MLPFFDRAEMKWSSFKGKLHIYATPPPGSSALVEFERMTSEFISHSGLGHQTAKHMHVTVQSFDAFSEDVTKPIWRDVRLELQKRLAQTQPFALYFDEPTVRSHAIEASGSPREVWDSLLSRIRSAFDDCGLDEIVCPPPYGPHYTLAYAIASTKDSLIVPILERNARRIAFEVGDVALVAVDQDPIGGVFEFRTIDRYRLGQRA